MEKTINKICKHLPEGLQINIAMESGSAWVELWGNDGDRIPLPDSADKNLIEQLSDALCVANGFDV